MSLRVGVIATAGEVELGYPVRCRTPRARVSGIFTSGPGRQLGDISQLCLPVLMRGGVIHRPVHAAKTQVQGY